MQINEDDIEENDEDVQKTDAKEEQISEEKSNCLETEEKEMEADLDKVVKDEKCDEGKKIETEDKKETVEHDGNEVAMKEEPKEESVNDHATQDKNAKENGISVMWLSPS